MPNRTDFAHIQEYTLTHEDVNGEKLTVKKRWIFGADFSRFTQSFSRFIRDINGEKKNISLLIWSFSRLVFHGLPPLEIHSDTRLLQKRFSENYFSVWLDWAPLKQLLRMPPLQKWGMTFFFDRCCWAWHSSSSVAAKAVVKFGGSEAESLQFSFVERESSYKPRKKNINLAQRDS